MSKSLRLSALAGLLLLCGSVGSRGETTDSASARPPLLRSYGNLPLSFEVNQGQADSSVRFLSRAGGSTLQLTRTEAILTLRRSPASTEGEGTNDIVRMRLVGANPAAWIEGVGELPGKSNYYIGNDPTKWRTNIPNFNRVKYHDVYPGVDLAYYGNQRQLEYDLIVAPGTDPRAIRLAFDGIETMHLNERGDLVLRTSGGDVVQQKPVVYQEIGGIRREIRGRYVIDDRNQVGVRVGRYDRSKPLVIDPVVSYSTFLGGGIGRGIAVDPAGNAYVTGGTDSLSFPTVNAVQPSYGGSNVSFAGDAFVTKFNSMGALVYSTYLGGSGPDDGSAIAVDPAGNAYAAGFTSSIDFPIKNAYRATGPSGFVAKLDATGALTYSTYFPAHVIAIAVDSAGSAYLTGGSVGEDSVPTTPGAFGAGSHGAFVTKLSPSGTTLDYSAIIGGDATRGKAIAVDSSGNAILTGTTGGFNLPVKNAYQCASRKSDFSFSTDAFVTKLNPTGSDLVFSTYLGSSCCDEDTGNAIAVDSAGSVYVAGKTPDSSDFPTTAGAFERDNSFGNHVFVTKFDTTGSLVYSTYLGAVNTLWDALGIAVDPTGSAYVTGGTFGSIIIANPFQTSIGSGYVTKLNTTGSDVVYSSYLGTVINATFEGGYAIAVDGSGSAYVTGTAESSSFPVTIATGSFEPPFSVFVTKVGAFDSETAVVGQPVTVSTVPGIPGDAGISATLTSGGGSPTIAAQSFPSDPGTANIIDLGGRYVDLKVTGATLADNVTAQFYYPSTMTGSTEGSLRLFYFTGSQWQPVASSGNTSPVKDTTDNLAGTVSGGRFTVVFDSTSTPKVTELTGTVFTSSVAVSYGTCLLYDPTRPIKSGSTIPIKFQLCDPAVGNLSSSGVVVTALGVTRVSNNAPGVLQDSGNANPDSNFRYDATLGGTGGYIYNLSAKGFATGTYTLSFKAGADKLVHNVQFEVK